MIDKIGFLTPLKSFQEYGELEAEQYLIGERIRKARMFGIKCRRSPEGLFYNCSLAKQYRGANVEDLSYDDIGEALRSLERRLQIDLRLCKLYTIEVGATIPVVAPPQNYLAEWGILPRTRKDLFNSGESVIFQNQTYSFSGYDKGSEIAPALLPPRYYPYAIRLEYRQKREVKRLFGRSVSPWDLVVPDIYLKLVNTWEEKYMAISCLEAGLDLWGINTPAELRTRLASIGLATIGANPVTAFINGQVNSGMIDKKTASRMRALERDLMSSGPTISKSNFNSELRAKVIAIAEHEKEEVADYMVGNNSRNILPVTGDDTRKQISDKKGDQGYEIR